MLPTLIRRSNFMFTQLTHFMLRPLFGLALLLVCTGFAFAQNEPMQSSARGDNLADPSSALNDQSLDQALQAIKKDVLALNRDLFILEEELLFPSNTQMAVFLSLDVGEFFKLDAVTITVDEKEVASHLYTDRQLDALVRGGVQRLYLGNIKSGQHEIVAVFTGRGPNERDFRRAASLTFDKTTSAKKLELLIKDVTRTYQPEFSIVDWD